MPKQVYMVDENHTKVCPSMLTDEQFIDVAKSQGMVFSLDKFQKVFNNQALDVDQNINWIRFL